MITVSARLQSYSPELTETVVGRVQEVMEPLLKDGYTYQQFLADYDIPEPDTYSPAQMKAVDVLDLKPKSDYDETKARVLYLPMGSGLTPNKIVRGVIAYLADPSERLVVIGNAGIPLSDGRGKLAMADMRRTSQGNLGPSVEPVLHYLYDQGVETTTQIGYSLGADKAAATAIEAERFDQAVEVGILMDPAAVANRGLLKLFKAFMSTDKGYKDYLTKTDFPMLAESRMMSENAMTYLLGLGRLSNLAIANALSKDMFEQRVDGALSANPDMKAFLMWGSDSELATDSRMVQITDQLKQTHGADRVGSTRFEGQKHGMADDVAFHAAMILHGVTRAKNL